MPICSDITAVVSVGNESGEFFREADGLAEIAPAGWDHSTTLDALA